MASVADLTPQAFAEKWAKSRLSERSTDQQHFLDLCRMLGQPTPSDLDPEGDFYTFEKGVKKTGGAGGLPSSGSIFSTTTAFPRLRWTTRKLKDAAKAQGADRGLRFVLAVFLASRLFYLVAGAALVRMVPTAPFQRATSDVPFGTINLWAHWDGEHYAKLALEGYLNPPSEVSPAFFPLYPLLTRLFSGLLGGPLSPGAVSLWGVLISLLALPFAFYFVYRVAEDGWGVRAAQGAVLALAFFPTSFYLNAAYTESLFLALSAGALWAVRVRKNLLLACLLAGLACATRNVGVFLIVPLGGEWFVGIRYYRWRGAYLALIPSGLLAYMAYLWWRFGEPLLFYTEQAKWDRGFAGPVTTAANALGKARESAGWLLTPLPHTEPSLGWLADHLSLGENAYNLLFLVLAGALLLAGLWILPLGLNVYAFLLVATTALFGTLETPLMALPRYVLVAFPLFIVLGVLFEDRRLLGGWLRLSAAFSLVLCALFVSWRFVA